MLQTKLTMVSIIYQGWQATAFKMLPLDEKGRPYVEDSAALLRELFPYTIIPNGVTITVG